MSVSNSQTLTCPQTMITNQSDPGSGESSWQYGTFCQCHGLLVFYNQWVWEVPFSSYATGQSTVTIDAQGTSTFVSLGCTPFQSCPSFGAALQSVVPLPFGQTFALQLPSVQSVSPTCANAGSAFVITGTGMYPSLVTSVLIGGVALDASQYTTNSDSSITVIAPEQSGEFLPVVVQTSQGVSNTNVTIEISVIDLCDT